MKPFWHPLSTLFLHEPRCFASPTVIRMLLRSGARQELVYAGDRMWPAVAHGAAVAVEPPEDRAPTRGEAVVACLGGIPDLFRVEQASDESLRLIADADPATSVDLPAGEVLGRIRLPPAVPSLRRRKARRLLLDLREAWCEQADEATDPAETVQGKYETQAPFYASTTDLPLDPPLLREVRRLFPPGGRLLVVGSGTGKESFAFAREGWRVTGVDFSPAMIELASAAPEIEDLDVEFLQADVRSFDPGKTFAGVFFTYDVYSFLPRSVDRVRTLRRIRTWLEPGATIFLSGRLLRSRYQTLVLTLQWLRHRGEWGSSHTRWITPDGRLNRSFVQVFRERRLKAEIAAAGFSPGPFLGGHQVLLPR